MEAFVTFLKKYKKFLIPIIAVLLIVVIVISVVSWVDKNRLKKALDLDSGSYERVQIKMFEGLKLPVDETSSEESDISTEDSQNQIFTAEDGYYDENGSFISDSSEETNNSSQDETDYNAEYTTIIKKDGDVFYQNLGKTEVYYYERDGQAYSLNYNDFFGVDDGGNWIEYMEDNISDRLMFDLNDFNSIDYKRFNKSGQKYIPEDDYLADAFYSIMGITEVNRGKYTVKSLSIKLDKNRVRTIETSYDFEADGKVVETDCTVQFTYNDTVLKIPKAGADTENN